MQFIEYNYSEKCDFICMKFDILVIICCEGCELVVLCWDLFVSGLLLEV